MLVPLQSSSLPRIAFAVVTLSAACARVGFSAPLAVHQVLALCSHREKENTANMQVIMMSLFNKSVPNAYFCELPRNQDTLPWAS